MSQPPDYDIVLWGASGFTGRLVAEYLQARYGDDDLCWALAGRSREKLESVRDALGAGAATRPVLTADSHDLDSLRAMCRQARVVCTTVGPYAHYGSLLVQACVETGTDYCDLSGEVPWMRRMIDAHQEAAQASGARIVHCCGFDSIPSDIGVHFLQREARKAAGAPASQVKFRLKAARGAASGGTIASLMNVLDEARADREVARILRNPYGLNPRDRMDGPDGPDLTGTAWDEVLGAWIGPFVMGVINTKVVRRTNALLDGTYGAGFRYDEAIVTGRGIGGRMKGWLTAGGLGALAVGAALPPSRWLLDRFVLAKPGEGPGSTQREQGFFNIILLGRLPDGEWLRARVTGDRDPGYGSTAKMLGESAVCLARDLADDLAGGFWTPASAMGDALLTRLPDNAGVRFELES